MAKYSTRAALNF